MPTVSIERDILFEHLGRHYTDESFDELCFEYGIELDEITSEREEMMKSITTANSSSSGAAAGAGAGAGSSSSGNTSNNMLSNKAQQQQLESYSDNVIYKIDVPANRYDLLCVEGISRALRIFVGDMKVAPIYEIANTTNTTIPITKMIVNKCNVDRIRPYIVCGILRNISFTKERYNSFIDLQDQLHRNLCRQRTLVAIGTHDMDKTTTKTITTSDGRDDGCPRVYRYDALKPEDIEFIPLTPDDRGLMKANDLLNIYETDSTCKHLKPYVHIIKESPLYPVVMVQEEEDNNTNNTNTNTVLSLPPIINSSHSKITLDTKNVLIECTATDLTKANIVLDTICTMFSEYCQPKPYVIEPVEIIYQDEQQNVVSRYITPQLSTRTVCTSIEFCNSMIGIQLDAVTMKSLCNRIQLGPATTTTLCNSNNNDNSNTTILQVTVPPTRSDILHPVDIAEDIGIAYGYNNIMKQQQQQLTSTVPKNKTCTVGGEQPLNLVSDLLREEISRAGYMEILTHGLCSYYDNYTALQRTIPSTTGIAKKKQEETTEQEEEEEKQDSIEAVSLSNPANIEYQIVRTTLLPGLLKTLQHNRSSKFTNGFKIFEISDIVFVDKKHHNISKSDTIIGARNQRMLCAIYSGPTSGFEIIHGLIDRIMTLVEIAPSSSYSSNSLTKSDHDEEQYRISKDGYYYTIQPLSNNHPHYPTYFPGRAASIHVVTTTTTKKKKKNSNNNTNNHHQDDDDVDDDDDIIIGTFGILHPNVLSNFDLTYPASCVEINLEAIM